jgi:hypothetical protein
MSSTRKMANGLNIDVEAVSASEDSLQLGAIVKA